jgi:ABC-type phosphate transport system substrate-binding protein
MLHIGNNFMYRSPWLYLAIILLAVPLCHARDLAIVVNKSNSASNLTAADLEKLLKAGTQNWPDGKKIKVFLTDPGSIDNKTILEHGCKLKPEEIKSLASAHRADLQVVGSDDAVLTMVDSNPGAIGIVNVYSINSRVKVLKVDEKLPMEPGYLLHGN